MAILLPLLSFGQEIKFMGLALGTDVDAFCKKLKEKGLKQTVDRFENKDSGLTPIAEHIATINHLSNKPVVMLYDKKVLCFHELKEAV